jgi:dethiobiotin synthetase
MAESYFVTGTDTGVGKTLVATAMLEAATARGWRTVGLKPVASGSEMSAHGLRNEDACQLLSATSEELGYEQVNPVTLAPAIAPHLALAAIGRQLTASELFRLCSPGLAASCDFRVIEGAGGWRVPLNHRETLADFARLVAAPVVMVVGIRLGCINHALLTAEAIRADGLRLAGWVANRLDPAAEQVEGIIETLDAMLGAPRIGDIPAMSPACVRSVASMLQLERLRETASESPRLM